MIYSVPELESGEKRWMCRVNENSKALPYQGIISETTHEPTQNPSGHNCPKLDARGKGRRWVDDE